jgi:uncharacterized protein YndB with AHSA1/START domain
MNKPSTVDPKLETWSMDREIVLSRVINAPRSKVFEAWTNADHLSKWFGPAGFTIENIACDIRVGGVWRFVMVAPDGTRFNSRILFLEIVANERIVMDHGTDIDHDPRRFRMTVTFDDQGDGKTVVTLRQLHPTKEQRRATIGFGAVEFGYQTLGKLASHIEIEISKKAAP